MTNYTNKNKQTSKKEIDPIDEKNAAGIWHGKCVAPIKHITEDKIVDSQDYTRSLIRIIH